MNKTILTIAGVAIFATTVYAIPAVKKYNIEGQIKNYQEYQVEQHDLAERSRETENFYRQKAQEFITKAEQEEDIQSLYGRRWDEAEKMKNELKSMLDDFQ